MNGFAKNSAFTKNARNPLSSSALLIDHYKKTLYGDSTSSLKPVSNPRQRKLVNLAQEGLKRLRVYHLQHIIYRIIKKMIQALCENQYKNGYFETSGTNFRLFNLEKRMIERKNEKPNQEKIQLLTLFTT